MGIYVKFLPGMLGRAEPEKPSLLMFAPYLGEKMGEMPYIYIIAYAGYFVNLSRFGASKNPCGHGFLSSYGAANEI